MAKYDVGVLGLWPGCNYGSIATYYALNRVLSSMGKSVLMIDKPIISDRDAERVLTHSRRFANEHYNISEQYRLDEFYKLNDLCDAFVIGSDQVWNYGISKNFGKAFYFDFAEESKKKIAYAVSFGHGVDFAPPEQRQIISRYMEKIDGISVREADGVKICKEEYGITAHHVLDPVFLADPEIYRPVIECSSAGETEPFLASYILDPTPEKREAILHLSQKLGGIKIVNMLDGLPWLFRKNKKAMDLPNCVENLQVEDWLYYLSHAEYVITDSCHGASFAVIFNKNLVGITNRYRGFSRFKSLFDLLDINSHLVTDPKTIIDNEELLKPIDYVKVNGILDSERARCGKWLSDALNDPKKSIAELAKQNRAKTPYRLPKEMCMGCGSCVSVCPKNAITLDPDDLGYYTPKINENLCVDCGLCTEKCPYIRLPENKNDPSPECCAFTAKSGELLYNSSSGGVFPLLANEALKKNGVIVGAAWKDDLTVGHIIAETAEEVEKLKKSKYFQSYMGDIDRKIKSLLDEGRFVLFSGCPCQTAGLKKYLGKDYGNLIMVDLFCGYAPSPMFFRKYIEDSFPEGVNDYMFRDKKNGWNCESVSVTLKDGRKIERHGRSQDLYQAMYHPHVMCPLHCEKCRYQSLPRYGDITIGDFWGYTKKDPEADPSKGVSAVLLNNEKGKAFFELIPKEAIAFSKTAPLSWLGGNGSALPGKHNWRSPYRDKFYSLIKTEPFGKAAGIINEMEARDRKALPANIPPVAFSSRQTHFIFDEGFWTEEMSGGQLVIRTSKPRSPLGKFACLPLNKPLEKGKTYTLSIRCTVRSAAHSINLHVVNMDSPKQKLQIIKELKSGDGFNDKPVELRAKFTAKSDEFNAFAVGAAQFSGNGAYFKLDFLGIAES